MYTYYSAIFSPSRKKGKAEAFIWTNLGSSVSNLVKIWQEVENAKSFKTDGRIDENARLVRRKTHTNLKCFRREQFNVLNILIISLIMFWCLFPNQLNSLQITTLNFLFSFLMPFTVKVFYEILGEIIREIIVILFIIYSANKIIK